MFVLADRAGIVADGLADPATAVALATTAIDELRPWNGAEPAAGVRGRALTLALPLRDLIAAVVTDPRNAWWSAPLDRSAQLLLSDRVVDPMNLTAPTGPLSRWEVYAQKPEQGIRTSTELPVSPGAPIRSGAHAELVCGSRDWSPSYPLHQIRLHVSPRARVYEIGSPADWHALARRYGDLATHPGPDTNLLSSGGIDHGLAPTWSAVARDWEGMHLSLAGLLTTLFVPLTTDRVTTTLWSWESECTHWLRPAFTASTLLPDLIEEPEDPDLHRQW